MIKDKKKYLLNKGVTLIALVVTIVVLLILAGISISLLTGDNGTISQANKSKEETEISEEKAVINYAITSSIEKDKYAKIKEKYI